MTWQLCTGCALSYQIPGIGLCEECHRENLRRQAAEADLDRGDKRRAWWRDKQRKHRDSERLRPSEPLEADADPLQAGAEAVELLGCLRAQLHDAQHVGLLDMAIELVKQLGWGPETRDPEPDAPHPSETEPRRRGRSKAGSAR